MRKAAGQQRQEILSEVDCWRLGVFAVDVIFGTKLGTVEDWIVSLESIVSLGTPSASNP